MDMSLSKLQELVMDREVWYTVVHEVAKSLTRLSNWTELNFRVCLNLNDYQFKINGYSYRSAYMNSNHKSKNYNVYTKTSNALWKHGQRWILKTQRNLETVEPHENSGLRTHPYLLEPSKKMIPVIFTGCEYPQSFVVGHGDSDPVEGATCLPSPEELPTIASALASAVSLQDVVFCCVSWLEKESPILGTRVEAMVLLCLLTWEGILSPWHPGLKQWAFDYS